MLGGGIAVFIGEVRGYLVKFLSYIGIFLTSEHAEESTHAYTSRIRNRRAGKVWY